MSCAAPKARMSVSPATAWSVEPIAQIEDLRDAVLGAGLDATQMASGAMSGAVAFARERGIVFSSGFIGNRVALTGSLSQDAITLGVGITLPVGTRHWLSEVESGEVGVFLAGDEHDALYPSGAIYASATLSAEDLESAAADRGLVLNEKLLGGTRVHARRMADRIVAPLRGAFERLHDGRATPEDSQVGSAMLDALIRHLARRPLQLRGRLRPNCHGRIVARARAYILEHLSEPILVDDIAAAACTSRRTLFRALAEILDESPSAYIRRLRLHRIRHDLAGEAERACTIALVANDWGMSDLGRMAGSYRELFGEKPSETLAKVAMSELQIGTDRIDAAPTR